MTFWEALFTPLAPGTRELKKTHFSRQELFYALAGAGTFFRTAKKDLPSIPLLLTKLKEFPLIEFVKVSAHSHRILEDPHQHHRRERLSWHGDHWQQKIEQYGYRISPRR